MLRALIWFTMLGALAGGAVGSIFGYRLALFWFDPGNNTHVQAALCPCLANAQDAIHMFFRSQATGCVVGVVLFNVVGLLFRKKLAQRAAARTAKNTIPPQA
jgi:hypothetical protein